MMLPRKQHECEHVMAHGHGSILLLTCHILLMSSRCSFCFNGFPANGILLQVFTLSSVRSL